MPRIMTLACALALTFVARAALAVESPMDFVTKAGQGDMMEVQLAKVALRKSHNSEVRAFASQMIKDHTKSGAELRAVADQARIRAPLRLDKDHRDKIAGFDHKGDSFDKDYVDFMASDHSDDVAEYDDFAKNGQDPHLRAFVQKTLPVLMHHKDMIDSIKAKM